MSKLSVIIISDARIKGAHQHTKNCITSLGDKHELIVVESAPNIDYEGENVKTLHPKLPFNYNAYLNYGYTEVTREFIAFCNNDLIFEDMWYENIINAMMIRGMRSASPICPKTHAEFGYSKKKGAVEGTETRRMVAGWCLVLRRDWYEKMKGFDERWKFWCADNSYTRQLIKLRERHILVLDSVVHHLGSKSLDQLGDAQKHDYTLNEVKRFNREFGTNLFNL